MLAKLVGGRHGTTPQHTQPRPSQLVLVGKRLARRLLESSQLRVECVSGLISERHGGLVGERTGSRILERVLDCAKKKGA